MAEDDPKKTPDHGPIPDPHADKPAPRPDPHTRPEPGARARRPDQDEDLGPVPELFGAAGLEAATYVSDDPVLREEAIRRGAEVEGLETAQIFGLLLATAAVLIAIVVAVAVLMTRAGIVEEERRAAAVAYPELEDLRRAEQERLTAYGRLPEERFHISLDRAQALLAAEARARRDAGIATDHELPDSPVGFNLSHARWGVPGLVPAPGSPAARILDPRPRDPEAPEVEVPLEAPAQGAQVEDQRALEGVEPEDAPSPPVN